MERRNKKDWAYYLRICATKRILGLSLVLIVVIFTPIALSFHKPSNVAERQGVTFLTFRFPTGNNAAVDDAESACKYYEAIGAITDICDIDPDTKEPKVFQRGGTTFNKWKSDNGFAINPDANRDGNPFNDDSITGEVSALYTNLVDLNLGRAMHAKKEGGEHSFLRL